MNCWNFFPYMFPISLLIIYIYIYMKTKLCVSIASDNPFSMVLIYTQPDGSTNTEQMGFSERSILFYVFGCFFCAWEMFTFSKGVPLLFLRLRSWMRWCYTYMWCPFSAEFVEAAVSDLELRIHLLQIFWSWNQSR